MYSTMHSKRQTGAVLIVGLIILVIATIVALSSMKKTLTQIKMAGGNADQTLAFEAAELALKDAEAYVYSSLASNSGFNSSCTSGLCLPSLSAIQMWDSIDWAGGLPIVYGSKTSATAISQVSEQPRYIIELLPDTPPALGSSLSMTIKPGTTGDGTPYRITAFAKGHLPGTQVMLQSVYIKP